MLILRLLETAVASCGLRCPARRKWQAFIARGFFHPWYRLGGILDWEWGYGGAAGYELWVALLGRCGVVDEWDKKDIDQNGSGRDMHRLRGSVARGPDTTPTQRILFLFPLRRCLSLPFFSRIRMNGMMDETGFL